MKTIISIITLILLAAGNLWAGIGNAIDVRIVTDYGQTLPTYPVNSHGTVHKAYAEATRGEHYKISVTNRLNRRVGVVIAVDGRNIITGGKSWLKSSERMYILEPHGSGEFAGWRTRQDRINRFYFTDVPDSYAAAFGDNSAMGVIAVAAFPEVRRYEAPVAQSYGYHRDSAARSESAPAPAAAPAVKKSKRSALESAGTGYGQSEYSPSYNVAFEAERYPVESVLLKYEWRSTLCKLGVISCQRPYRQPHNRLWNDGYAPPPPGR